MLNNINKFKRHNVLIRHKYLNDIKLRILVKVMRHNYVAQFYATYIHLQESDSNPISGPVRNGYFQFIVVSQQFKCTTSTRPIVGEFRVTPILRRVDVLGQNRTA